MRAWEEDAETLAQARREVRRMHRARRFPTNTDPWSRHVAIMAAALSQHGAGAYPMLAEEPRHCAASLAATVGELWRTRTENERLRKQLAKTKGAKP